MDSSRAFFDSGRVVSLDLAALLLVVRSGVFCVRSSSFNNDGSFALDSTRDGRFAFGIIMPFVLFLLGTGVTQAMEEDASCSKAFRCSWFAFNNEGTAIGESAALARSVSSSLEEAMGMMRNLRFLKGSEVVDDDSEPTDRDLRFLKGSEMGAKIPGETEASLWVSFAVTGVRRCSCIDCIDGIGETLLVMMAAL